MLPAMFTGFRDSMDSVRLFKLLWAVCDFDYLESQDMIDAMRTTRRASTGSQPCSGTADAWTSGCAPR